MPAGEGEAQETIGEIERYCRVYCPAFQACREEACRLYRIETTAAEFLAQAEADAAGRTAEELIAL
jgi:hypothetical protein